MKHNQTREFSSFTQSLMGDIKTYAAQNGRTASAAFWIKAVLLLFTWTFLYLKLIFYPPTLIVALPLALAWGVLSLLIIFNIGHDAVHGVISKNDKVNKLMSYAFNLVGGNAYSWKLKHNVAHHINTNIEQLDFDTDLDPVLRVSKESKQRKWYKWQMLWFWIVYSMLSLLIIFVGDFKIFAQTKKVGLVKKHPFKEYFILAVSKLLYLSLIFIIPTQVGDYSLSEVLIAFGLYHIINGWIIAIVFMPSHYFEKSVFFNEGPNKESYNWMAHQISSTTDLSANSQFITSILGALNHNVSHHLFPNFCHNHYPAIARIVRTNCKKYNVPINGMSFGAGIISHIKHLNAVKE